MIPLQHRRERRGTYGREASKRTHRGAACPGDAALGARPRRPPAIRLHRAPCPPPGGHRMAPAEPTAPAAPTGPHGYRRLPRRRARRAGARPGALRAPGHGVARHRRRVRRRAHRRQPLRLGRLARRARRRRRGRPRRRLRPSPAGRHGPRAGRRAQSRGDARAAPGPRGDGPRPRRGPRRPARAGLRARSPVRRAPGGLRERRLPARLAGARLPPPPRGAVHGATGGGAGAVRARRPARPGRALQPGARHDHRDGRPADLPAHQDAQLPRDRRAVAGRGRAARRLPRRRREPGRPDAVALRLCGRPRAAPPGPGGAGA